MTVIPLPSKFKAAVYVSQIARLLKLNRRIGSVKSKHGIAKEKKANEMKIMITYLLSCEIVCMMSLS